jgi:N-acetylglutamate synthase-like GNAT family acetyltransferase
MDTRPSYPVSCGLYRSARAARLRPVPVAQPPTLRTATSADVKFLSHLQRKFSGALGFLPTIAQEWYARHSCVTLALENDTPAGYILGRPTLKWNPLIRPIYQACVAMDARRRHHGLALLADLESKARAAGQLAVQANCAADLEATEFWRAAGFIPVAHLTPANVRSRDVICWRKALTSQIPAWFIDLPQRAGSRASKPVSIRSTRHQFPKGAPLTP